MLHSGFANILSAALTAIYALINSAHKFISDVLVSGEWIYTLSQDGEVDGLQRRRTSASARFS